MHLPTMQFWKFKSVASDGSHTLQSWIVCVFGSGPERAQEILRKHYGGFIDGENPYGTYVLDWKICEFDENGIMEL